LSSIRTFLALCAALLALPSSAAASDALRVEPEGAAETTVTLSGLGAPDVQGREYTVTDSAGQRRVAITGHSLDKVLGAANVDPYRFADVRVAAGALSVTLDRGEVTRPGTFADGPPVFWMEGNEARFLRPASASGGSVQVAGGPLTVSLSRQSELEVTARASRRRVERGEPVTFTAAVSGAPDGEPVTLSWYFDDGAEAIGARVTHRFRRAGSYDVLVGATTASDRAGADATVTVQVGEERSGPDRKGGGTNRDADAPDSGAATGPNGPSGGGVGDAATAPSGSEGAGGADDDRPRDERTATQPPTARSRAAARRRAQREREPAPRREAETASTGSAREVEGIELADLSALSSRAGRDALRAARTGRPREEDQSGGGIPPGLWWTLGTTALLGLGAWREARGRPTARAT
jgi:PKD domain